MKSIIVLIFLFIPFGCFSQSNWSQRNQDKIAHVGVGYIVGATTYHFLYRGTKNKWKSRVGSVVIASFVGGLKEYLDNKPKWSDVLYTASGSILHWTITF